MSDDALRAAVRAAIDRHLARRGTAPSAAPEFPARGRAPDHPGFTLCLVPAGGDTDGGACLIEPSVACTHCGFCRVQGY